MKLGYTLLYVDDVAQALKFYEKAFGFEAGFIAPSKEYGELKTGETKLGFVQHATAAAHGFSYQRMHAGQDPAAFEIGFVTEDVAGAYDRAVMAGAIPVAKPKTKPWGQIVSYVRDPHGFLIELCSPVG